MAPQPRDVLVAPARSELLEHAARAERLELVLREEGDRTLWPGDAPPRREHAGHDAQQRRLACAIGPRAHPVAAAQQAASIRVHGVRRSACGRPRARHHLAGPHRRRDPQPHASRLLSGAISTRSSSAQRLDPALDLTGFGGLVTEALDERSACAISGPLRGARLELCATLPLPPARSGRSRPRRRSTAPFSSSATRRSRAGRCDRGRRHAAARNSFERLLEPLDRGQIEMVGRLVEQQHVGRGQQPFASSTRISQPPLKLASGRARAVSAKPSPSSTRSTRAARAKPSRHRHL